jgi:hypothetical protein
MGDKRTEERRNSEHVQIMSQAVDQGVHCCMRKKIAIQNRPAAKATHTARKLWTNEC